MSKNNLFESVYIEGKNINLRRPLAKDAITNWYGWFNDQEVALFTGWWKPNTPEKQLKFLRYIENSQTDLILIIESKVSLKPIGVVSLSKINWVQKIADIALIIGDKSSRNNPLLGLEAFTKMIRHGFLRLNLKNIRGGYISGQTASGLILKATGFVEIGSFKNIYEINGKLFDHILVHLSSENWKSRNLK